MTATTTSDKAINSPLLPNSCRFNADQFSDFEHADALGQLLQQGAGSSVCVNESAKGFGGVGKLSLELLDMSVAFGYAGRLSHTGWS